MPDNEISLLWTMVPQQGCFLSGNVIHGAENGFHSPIGKNPVEKGKDPVDAADRFAGGQTLSLEQL